MSKPIARPSDNTNVINVQINVNRLISSVFSFFTKSRITAPTSGKKVTMLIKGISCRFMKQSPFFGGMKKSPFFGGMKQSPFSGGMKQSPFSGGMKQSPFSGGM